MRRNEAGTHSSYTSQNTPDTTQDDGTDENKADLTCYNCNVRSIKLNRRYQGEYMREKNGEKVCTTSCWLLGSR